MIGKSAPKTLLGRHNGSPYELNRSSGFGGASYRLLPFENLAAQGVAIDDPRRSVSREAILNASPRGNVASEVIRGLLLGSNELISNRRINPKRLRQAVIEHLPRVSVYDEPARFDNRIGSGVASDSVYSPDNFYIGDDQSTTHHAELFGHVRNEEDVANNLLQTVNFQSSTGQAKIPIDPMDVDVMLWGGRFITNDRKLPPSDVYPEVAAFAGQLLHRQWPRHMLRSELDRAAMNPDMRRYLIGSPETVQFAQGLDQSAPLSSLVSIYDRLLPNAARSIGAVMRPTVHRGRDFNAIDLDQWRALRDAQYWTADAGRRPFKKSAGRSRNPLKTLLFGDC